MTEEMIMEQLSKGYVALVGGYRGYKHSSMVPDSGVDLIFCPTIAREEPSGATRWIDSDKHIHIQVKSVHRKRVICEKKSLVYDLEAKTYNDLVSRREGYTPLYLVVLVLPDDRDDWLGVTPEELAVRRCAYWWRPDLGAQATTNTSQIRIRIPLDQRVTCDFFPDRFVEFYGVDR